MLAKLKIQACRKIIHMSEAIGMDVSKEKQLLDKMTKLYEEMSKASAARKKKLSKKIGS